MSAYIPTTRYRWKSLKKILLDKLVLLNPEFEKYHSKIRYFNLSKISNNQYRMDFTQSGIRVIPPSTVTITINTFTLEQVFKEHLSLQPNTIDKADKQQLIDFIPEGTNYRYDDKSDTLVILPYVNFNIGDTILVDDNTPIYTILLGEYSLPLVTRDKVDLVGLSNNNRLAISVFDYIEPRDDI